MLSFAIFLPTDSRPNIDNLRPGPFLTKEEGRRGPGGHPCFCSENAPHGGDGGGGGPPVTLRGGGSLHHLTLPSPPGLSLWRKNSSWIDLPGLPDYPFPLLNLNKLTVAGVRGGLAVYMGGILGGFGVWILRHFFWEGVL